MNAVPDRDGRATPGRVDAMRDEIEQLRHLADHDSLTGVPNRRRMISDLNELSAYSKSLAGFCLIDLDDFKAVNDSLGHLAGDELLIAVATRIGAALAGKGRLYRIGGDEFGVAVLQPFTPREMALVVHQCLSQPVPLSASHSTGADDANPTNIVRISASVGCAVATDDGQTIDELIAAADFSLHRAKRGKHSPSAHTAPLASERRNYANPA